MIAASPPPVPCVHTTLALPGRTVDLAARVLVAGVVPAPRFGRESEAVATADALVARGADLVDVSLPARLLGPVARGRPTPVVARVGSVDEARAAADAGASLVLVPPALAGRVVDGLGAGTGGAAVGVVVDRLEDVATARAAAEPRGLPLALDSTRWSASVAIAHEAAAVTEGCRVLCTTDVRRSRRVAEVMAALLAARRPGAATPPHGTGEAP